MKSKRNNDKLVIMMASNLIAMASNLPAMVSTLVAMASNLSATGRFLGKICFANWTVAQLPFSIGPKTGVQTLLTGWVGLVDRGQQLKLVLLVLPVHRPSRLRAPGASCRVCLHDNNTQNKIEPDTHSDKRFPGMWRH